MSDDDDLKTAVEKVGAAVQGATAKILDLGNQLASHSDPVVQKAAADLIAMADSLNAAVSPVVPPAPEPPPPPPA